MNVRRALGYPVDFSPEQPIYRSTARRRPPLISTGFEFHPTGAYSPRAGDVGWGLQFRGRTVLQGMLLLASSGYPFVVSYDSRERVRVLQILSHTTSTAHLLTHGRFYHHHPHVLSVLSTPKQPEHRPLKMTLRICLHPWIDTFCSFLNKVN